MPRASMTLAAAAELQAWGQRNQFCIIDWNSATRGKIQRVSEFLEIQTCPIMRIMT